MKKHLSFFLLWFPFFLVAQNTDNEAAAKVLHETGVAILQKELPTSFDKLLALGQFMQSQKKLDSSGVTTGALLIENQKQLSILHAFFTKSQNSDNLLELSLFYPDSVFQANTTYTDQQKLLITDYLTFKRVVTRTAFFKIRDLNYQPIFLKEKETNSTINFDNYWPLEVLAFEDWLQREEKTMQGFPKKAKNKLLRLSLQHELETLQKQEDTRRHGDSKKRLLNRIEEANANTEASNAAYSRLKQIGLGILGLVIMIGYFLWKKNDKLLKSNNQSLLEEKKRSEDLLSNMLPTEVVRELKQKGSVKAHKYESASVLFSDFKNFSQIAETLSPEELVRELDYCFTVFDRIIDKYRLQKIKTIGDAYMCVGGLYTRGGNHVQRMVYAALEIQQFLADRKAKRTAKDGHLFEARVGIHTGPIVAGVIGRKKIAFDVWGDTVNVAQQMEHHSSVGIVNISGETYERVKDKFECTHRGTVKAKNQRVYDMYFVNAIVNRKSRQ